MAEVHPAYALQAATPTHPAKLFRRVLQGLMSEGVCTAFNNDDDLKVSAGGAFNATVAKGGALVKGDDATDQGLYFVYNDGNVTLGITNASALTAGQSRKDLVIARVKDADEGGAAGNTWALEVVQGTAGSPGAEPALPASALKLAVLTVNFGDASLGAGNISDSRVRTSPFLRPKVYLDRPSADYTLTSSPVDVTGWTQTIDVRTAQAYVLVFGKMEIRQTASCGAATGTLVVDGSNQSGAMVVRDASTSPDVFMDATQFWLLTLSAGTHTLKVQASASGGTPGNGTVNAANSGLLIVVLD